MSENYKDFSTLLAPIRMLNKFELIFPINMTPHPQVLISIQIYSELNGTID